MAKSSKKAEVKKVVKKETEKENSVKEENVTKDIRDDYNPSEPTIKEMMLVKSVDRDEAIRILRNPTPHKVND